MANEGSNDLIQFDGGALVADMLAEASAEHALELTQYAIEDGATINDHAVQQPRKLTLTLVQTESPLTTEPGFARLQQEISYQRIRAGSQTVEVPVAQKEFRPTSLLALTSGAQQALFGGPSSLRITGLKSDGPVTDEPLKVSVLAADGDVGRVNAFHEQLVALLDSVTPVQVTYKQRSYEAMVITSVTRTDSAGQFGAARFTLQLQQIATAETRLVELPPVPQATKKSNVGKVAPKPATPAQTEYASTSFRAVNGDDQAAAGVNAVTQ
jgi:hypothetical protein